MKPLEEKSSFRTEKRIQDVNKLHELRREELEQKFNAAPFVANLGIMYFIPLSL